LATSWQQVGITRWLIVAKRSNTGLLLKRISEKCILLTIKWRNNAPLLGNNAPLLGNNAPLLGKDAPLLGKDAPLLGNNAPLLGKDAA